MTRTSTLLELNEAMPAVVFTMAILRLIAAVGLWLGWRRAWPLTMILVGTGLLLSLSLYAVGDPPYARLAIDIIIAFYLNQGVVRDYFEGRPEKADAGHHGSQPVMTEPLSDLDLLRAFEPVVRYTNGELFFPTGVEHYLAECDLLVGPSERERRVLVPQGELTPASLATFIAPPGESLYLRLVQKPLNGLELRRWRSRPGRIPFSAPGRLARVGLFARLLDAGFTASLLLRGSVPGGTAAAAQIKYAHARETRPPLRLPRPCRP